MAKVRKPATFWITKHENLLLTLWNQNICALKNSRQRRHIYQAIAEKLIEAGQQVKWKDVKSKLDYLTRKYKKELRHSLTTGNKSIWRHFDKIQPILGDVSVANEPLPSDDNETISKEEQFDYEDLASSDASNSSLLNQELGQRHIVDMTEPTVNTEHSPATKKRKASNNNSGGQLTPFEKAMLEIETDRSERLEHIARQRLRVMRRMAAENSDFHNNIIALMKSKK